MVSYSVGDVRRWGTTALITAGAELADRRVVAEDARRALVDGPKLWTRVGMVTPRMLSWARSRARRAM